MRTKLLPVLLMMIFMSLSCTIPGVTRETEMTAPGFESNLPHPENPQQSTLPVAPPPPSTNSIQPDNFAYLGAIRLPDAGERPFTFAYGGEAMTYNPDGDPMGPEDGTPGSLFIMGHSRMPYGELPNGNQVAEVSIPRPVATKDINALNTAEFLQEFGNVAEGFFTTLEEIPRAGMQYLNRDDMGPKIHLAWGAHFQEDENTNVASHAWFNPDLSKPEMQGVWFIDGQSPYSVNGYMLEIPGGWAEKFVDGYPLGTGRFKDGGWSGMGPSLFAYRPWDEGGRPAKNNARLDAVPLLLYESSREMDEITRAMDGYQHNDEWEGAAWLTTSNGREALLFAGNKSIGQKSWYGFINPAGPGLPCIDQDFVGQFPICRTADGGYCPDSDLHECPGHTSERGWWGSASVARFILYDTAQIARVATGQLQPWEPQPYAWLDIEENLFLNPAGIETDLIGSGVQRRYKVGDLSFDRGNGLLYLLEYFADDAKPVVHVWKVN